jgi:hypothetical protein
MVEATVMVADGMALTVTVVAADGALEQPFAVAVTV